MSENFDPTILAFCCNWCAYSAADLAGTSRLQYPPTVKIIRVMCSSRVDPTFILKAFRRGVDGVLVAGCLMGTCHYIDGNQTAEKRLGKVMKSLEAMGFGGRLHVEWIGASEGRRFAETIISFTEKLRKLGPNPIKLEVNMFGKSEG